MFILDSVKTKPASMTSTFQRAFIALVIALLWVTGATAETVPDSNALIHMYPGAAEAGPPSIIKPGTRLVYWGGSTSIAGSYKQLVLDPKGKRWFNKATGQALREQDVPSVAGEGYSVLRVGHVDRNLVTLSTSSYLLDRNANKVTPSGGSGMVTHAGCAGDYWVHPKVLANIQPLNQDGVVISRMTFPLNGKNYNAIAFRTTDRNGNSMYVYDLDSGLMITHGSKTYGGDIVVPGTDGRGTVGRGSTMLVSGNLVDVSQIDVPWKDAPTPEWVGQFRSLTYRGISGSTVPGVGTYNQQMQYVATVKARGNSWVRLNGHTAISTQGFPANKSQNASAYGHASVGGLWIPPQSLGKLQRGQVIETNRITHTKTVITDVQHGYVTLTEFGDAHRNDVTYATNNGVLTGLKTYVNLGTGSFHVQLRLTGQQ